MKVFDAKEHIQGLNLLKQKFSTFDSATIRAGFKFYGIPSGMMFWQEVINFKLVTRIGIDLYQFTSQNPIHYTTLKIIYDRYANKVNQYNKKDTEIQRAIKLLKESGYTIIKGKIL